jgi:two-component system response regulator GlrR
VPRLLIIEDDPRVLKGLQQLLAKPDRDFVLASTVSEAILAVSRGAVIDLALVDHHLPDGSGLEVVGELRRLHPGVHVIVMTADPSVDNLALAMERGVNRYIQKPFDAGELRWRVDEALAEHEISLDLSVWARVFDMLEQMVVIVDELGRIRRANRAALRQAGAGSEAALIGTHVHDLPGEPWQTGAELLLEVRRGAPSAAREVTQPRNGEVLKVNAALLRTPTGAHTGAMLQARLRD